MVVALANLYVLVIHFLEPLLDNIDRPIKLQTLHQVLKHIPNAEDSFSVLELLGLLESSQRGVPLKLNLSIFYKVLQLVVQVQLGSQLVKRFHSLGFNSIITSFLLYV